MRCQNCGYENPQSTKFCGSCGATLKNHLGQNVKIPPKHIMSPRDEAMDAIPLIRRGRWTAGGDITGFG